jgi:hypothetical protein
VGQRLGTYFEAPTGFNARCRDEDGGDGTHEEHVDTDIAVAGIILIA